MVYTLSGTDARYFEIRSSGNTDGQITVGARYNPGLRGEKELQSDREGLGPQRRIGAGHGDDQRGRTWTSRRRSRRRGWRPWGTGTSSTWRTGDGAVGQYTATGPNANNVSWRLSGPDASDFSISRAGQLTFRSTPNFEKPADSDRDNIYELTVTARSGRVQDAVECNGGGDQCGRRGRGDPIAHAGQLSGPGSRPR